MTRYLGRVSRCVRCRMQVHLCICRHVRPVPTETRVLVLIHPQENNKPSNTGHLAPLLLPNARLVLATQDHIDGLEQMQPVRLLFPRPEAECLNGPINPAITLVVPDAPWRKARRMAMRWPAFRDLPALRLPEGPARAFHLRKTVHGPNALGTLEAIGRALGILESQYVEDEIRKIHERIVLRGLYARGRAPADEELRKEIAEARALGLEVP